jgi:beta-ureidopropionase / N-carbamoyl-L-amino-acid hydrolase
MQAACPPRFATRFEAFSAIGATGDGGVHRMEATEANGDARRQLVAWLKHDGFAVRIDRVGNIFGLLELAGPDAPWILAGSHVDSQPYGGRFDGAYGVIAAIEVAAALRDAIAQSGERPRANLAVVAWSGEEGARFKTLLGSRAFAQATPIDTILADRDVQGVSLRDALEGIGFLGTDDPPPVPDAYVELHVECGSQLETQGGRLGIFERWWGAHKLDITFLGETSHTGPTPMAKRKDALYGAAQIVAGVRHLADAAAVGDLHTSVGKLIVVPNSPNVVPGTATACVELRSPKADVIASARDRLMEMVSVACATARVTYRLDRDDLRIPGCFDQTLGALARRLAGSLGFEPLGVETLPGHDAVTLAAICPVLMLTVPSLDGLCHHPAEWTSPEDLELGAAWLASVLRSLVIDGPPARSSHDNHRIVKEQA